MADFEDPSSSSGTNNLKVLRCMDWLQKQNSQEVKKSLRNKNDIQFIIQMNADRKNFLLAAAEDEASVPPGVGENTDEPKAVPLRRLRVEELSMECEWQGCRLVHSGYEMFQKHVKEHIKDLLVINKNETNQYVCLWDVCGYKTTDFKEMVRHINYHAYHTKLLSIGFNGRATLKLLRCRKDSTRRNMLPILKSNHCCMWTECNQSFTAIQDFFDHVKVHINYSSGHVCSWGGCGAKFPRKVLLTMHCRTHTNEKLIACYHCGQHFVSNRKLMDHLRRQNVNPNSPYSCSMCGMKCATQYLLDEHQRSHVSVYACALCDMSTQSPAALAQHVRYRHLDPRDSRTHACRQCHYKAVTKFDLRKHMNTHKRKRKKREPVNSDIDISEESEPEVKKKKKERRKYACHLCPKNEMKVYSRGTELTKHLVKIHGAQWPFGYSRFRYQISEDGIYRLTTTRYEYLEVSKKIVDGGPKKSLTSTNLDFTLQKAGDATFTTPTKFQIVLKGEGTVKEEIEPKDEQNNVEITMCDVDEKGNIIKSEILKSDVVFRS